MIASVTAQPRPKPVLWFAAHAIALSLLIGLWPTPRAAYPALFHVQANALFEHLESPDVRLGPGTLADTAMVVAAPRAGPTAAWESSFSVVRIGYWPTAVLLAMLLATPLSPKRRALAAVFGLVLVDVFALARIGVEVAYLLQLSPPHAVTHDRVPLLLGVGSESLTATIPSAAFVLVCWVALARPWRTIDLS
ncbi:MAG: hypothetical protein ACREI7_11650, partial [Myxococcota bacterium]